MLMLACFLVCLAAVPLTGGSLSALADFRPGKIWALWVALAIQAVIIFVPGGPSALYPAGHVVSYGFAFLFLWDNRDLSGLWLITLGAAMNSLATVANGGVMPATRSALEKAGIGAEGSGFLNSTIVDNPKLVFLGDVFAVPASFPLNNVFSPGDVCIVVGGAMVLFGICGSRFSGRTKSGALKPLKPLS
jgi:hypothetical protein